MLLVGSPEQGYLEAASRGRNLGTKAWTVVFHAPVDFEDRITQLEKEVKHLKADANTDAVYLGKPEVMDLASQVLLFAATEQPCIPSQASCFTDMHRKSKPALSSFVNDLGYMSPSSFASLADEFSTSRSRTLHFASWDSLADAEANCLKFITRHPDLRNECRKECVVLDSFHLIKQHFI